MVPCTLSEYQPQSSQQLAAADVQSQGFPEASAIVASILKGVIGS